MMSDWESEFGGDVLLDNTYRKSLLREDFREDVWRTKNGGSVKIKDMTDEHLFNAYLSTKRGVLFKEMVVRLFDQRVKAKKFEDTKQDFSDF